MHRSTNTNFNRDLIASLVVFLVALPLCMGIALASGVPPARGLITGIIGGIVVGAIAGAPLQVSGPAAGLTVICWDIVQEHGLAMLGAMVLVAGIIQYVAGVLRFGLWFRAISPAVIRGMLTGIGVLILASQFHVMVDDAPQGSGLQNLLSIPHAIMKGVVPSNDTTHNEAAYIGLLTIVILVLWNRFRPRKLHAIPGSIVAVVTATLAVFLLDMPIKTVSVPESLLGSVALPTLDLFAIGSLKTLFVGAGVIAVVASAETLLCATAVDHMHDGERTDYNKELRAQGIGNTICGFLGALPMTGVIVRSSANIDAGATSRRSAMLHGVWILALVACLPGVLAAVPTACLAAVLVHIGYKLIDRKIMQDLKPYGKTEIAIFFATVICIVSFDLLTGVTVGFVLAVAKLAYTFSHLDVEEEKRDGKRLDMHLVGAATFLGLPILARRLEAYPPDTELHVYFDKLTYIDHACLELFTNWEKQVGKKGGKVVLEWHDLRARSERKQGLQRSVGRLVREHTNPNGKPLKDPGDDPNDEPNGNGAPSGKAA